MMQINQVIESLFNRGFRGPKCNTLLKLATSHIKLLRNKRAIQLKQLRRELAQLLENGQESTAYIRVEHIVREQNIMLAYDTLQLFCELLIVGMPIIESQSKCPLDLREAVASLIFAAPRASDLPELLEVQNMFSFKYGKDFVAAATELRPDCNVNVLVIEKLSARAPTMKVKLNLIKEIAEEHGIEWDSGSTELEFSKSPEDLLDGPNHFIRSSEMSPIPFHLDDLPADQLKSDSLSQEEESSLPSPNLSTHLHSVDLIQEPKFVPFLVPPGKSRMETMPSRFYSPPRESSIIQPSDLLKETLLKRSHSRTISEGGINLQDIIEAAEAAAESAEKAARAARVAANLARSRISPRSSKDIKYEESMPQFTFETDHNTPSMFEINSNVDIGTDSGKVNIHLVPDSYDWTQESEGEKHQEKKVAHVDVLVEDKDQLDGDIRSTFDDYGDNIDSYGDMPSSYHQHSMKGESPFLNNGKFFISATYDRLGHNEESGEGHQPVYDASTFDSAGTAGYPKPFQEFPSLEDDPYYTYPNLFSKPSSGSIFPS